MVRSAWMLALAVVSSVLLAPERSAAQVFVAAPPVVSYYYPPPVYSAPASPPVYVERSDTQPAPQSAPQSSPQADNSWYYCRDSQTYYPYVKECASPWQRVSPRPPGL